MSSLESLLEKNLEISVQLGLEDVGWLGLNVYQSIWVIEPLRFVHLDIIAV